VDLSRGRLILELELVGCEWSASRPGRHTPGERAPGTHWIGGWVGPTSPHFMDPEDHLTVFTRARHWSLSWGRWIQSTPCHSISLRSILIPSYHLWLDLPSGLFPSGFPTKILYFLFSTPSISPSFIWSSSVYVLPLMWETKLHTHTKQKENCSLFYILICMFLDTQWRTKDSEQNGSKHSPNLICSYFSNNVVMICGSQILNLATFLKALLAIGLHTLIYL
jgi:hypothetical protein